MLIAQHLLSLNASIIITEIACFCQAIYRLFLKIPARENRMEAGVMRYDARFQTD